MVAAMPRHLGAQAPALPKVTHLSAAELRAYTDLLAAQAARVPGRQVPGRPLGRDSVLAVFLLRRDTSGRPELHEQMADIFVVQSGQAVIVSGGRVEGARLMEPGEWNGGRIVPDSGTGTGAEIIRRPAGPGDVVVIPAGVPHQVEVPPGQSVTYLVLKVLRAGSGAAPKQACSQVGRLPKSGHLTTCCSRQGRRGMRWVVSQHQVSYGQDHEPHSRRPLQLNMGVRPQQ